MDRSTDTTRSPMVMVAPPFQRRRFTVEYKLWIVREADRCSKKGELAVLLEREGLYSSHLAMWRRAREHGELINVPKRGRKRKLVDPSSKRVADLERRLAEAMARAERAEALVERQETMARAHRAEALAERQKRKIAARLG